MNTAYAFLDADLFQVGWVETDDPAGPVVPEGLTAVIMSDRRPPKVPYVGARLKVVAGEFVWVDTRTLDDLKAVKNAEINAARMTANRSTFPFSGKQISCDELSRSDIDGANGIISLTSALPPGWPGAWKAVDNTYVAIPDVATWAAFYGAMVTQGTTNFMHAQALKAYMNDPDRTKEEVENITWGMEIPA